MLCDLEDSADSFLMETTRFSVISPSKPVSFHASSFYIAVRAALIELDESYWRQASKKHSSFSTFTTENPSGLTGSSLSILHLFSKNMNLF